MAPTPAPSDDVLADDHRFAAWAATVAGELLLDVRGQGLEGRELKDAGDAAAQELLARLLAEHRPNDAVLSEESRETHTDEGRLSAERVWIRSRLTSLSPAVISVSKKPGATALTVTPRRPTSRASERVMPSMAALLAPYAARPR